MARHDNLLSLLMANYCESFSIIFCVGWIEFLFSIAISYQLPTTTHSPQTRINTGADLESALEVSRE